MNKSPFLRSLLAVLCLCLVPLVAGAQEWPPKLTRIVVPYLTGTSPDVLARMLADKLTKKTGQAFIVDNKPGANSILGTNAVATSPADGSVLLLADRLALGVNPLLYKPPYNTKRDIASVTNIGDSKMYLAVVGDFPANTFHEFVAYAKANPGKITFGSGGNGHISHLNLESIESGAGIDILHVPYKGIADVIPAMLGNQIQATVTGVGNVQKLVEDKRVKLLAIGSPTRSALAPNVPTIREAGGTDDMLLSTSFSLHTRGGTPLELRRKISQQIAGVLADPEVDKYMRTKGIDPNPTTPEALDSIMEQDDKALTKLVRERNIHVD